MNALTRAKTIAIRFVSIYLVDFLARVEQAINWMWTRNRV